MAASSSAVQNEDEITKYRFGQRLSLALVSWLVPAVIALIGITLRVRFSFEEGAVRFDEIHPGIFPFWHGCVFPSIWIFRQQRLAVMTSRSLDGEYIARVIEQFGFVPIRGSSSRGGQRALLEMASFVQQGGGAAFTIDGPRGPRHLAKKGPVYLAKATGVPITAFYAAVEKKWEFNSWDRFVLPRPFSRVLVRAAKKICVARDADDARLEQCHREMQLALERVTQFAEQNLAAAWEAGLVIDSGHAGQ